MMEHAGICHLAQESSQNHNTEPMLERKQINLGK